VNPDALPANPKLYRSEDAFSLRQTFLGKDEKIVLTNGCFDLLHPGHIYYLQEAAKLGTQLWIALNADVSVQALKGPSRPILSEKFRAYALAALDCVYGVFLFSTPRLDAEIRAFQPDVYVKAGDYTLETLAAEERKALEDVGAKIQFMPYLEGFSTTELIIKITEAQSI
jgi:rfaE bifunctional protein nucleotidyltransferase chain/domain